MENLDASKGKMNIEGENIFGRFASTRDVGQGGKGAIEYFLIRLKRVDNEIVVSNAELREINEEISEKDNKIDLLKMKLESLMRDETSREIKRLEMMKAELKESVKKADRVLAGLGLIWVGENADMPNADVGVRFIANPEGSGYRPDPGYHEIRQDQTTVTPFTGRGYRLGTGSEIFTQVDSSDDQLPVQAMDCTPEGIAKSNVGSGFRATTSARRGHKTSSDNRIRQADHRATRTESFEKLPLEFRLMSESERRRALKQVSVQIQKNMNKYTI